LLPPPPSPGPALLIDRGGEGGGLEGGGDLSEKYLLIWPFNYGLSRRCISSSTPILGLSLFNKRPSALFHIFSRRQIGPQVGFQF